MPNSACGRYGQVGYMGANLNGPFEALKPMGFRVNMYTLWHEDALKYIGLLPRRSHRESVQMKSELFGLVMGE